MHYEIADLVKFLPADIKELQARAIFGTIFEGELGTKSSTVQTNQGTFTYYGWNDGGGQSYSLWLSDHQTALLTFYDHECNFNFYSGEPEDSALQDEFFSGVPDDLKSCVYNQEETYENLNIELENGDKIYTASGVFWFANSQWHINEKFAQLSVEDDDDGGANYCLSHLTFNTHSSLDEYVESLKKKWEDYQPGLDHLGEAIQAYNDYKALS